MDNNKNDMHFYMDELNKDNIKEEDLGFDLEEFVCEDIDELLVKLAAELNLFDKPTMVVYDYLVFKLSNYYSLDYNQFRFFIHAVKKHPELFIPLYRLNTLKHFLKEMSRLTEEVEDENNDQLIGTFTRLSLRKTNRKNKYFDKMKYRYSNQDDRLAYKCLPKIKKLIGQCTLLDYQKKEYE